MAIKFARPIHPGELLREEYLNPLGMSAGALAKAIGVPRTRIERLVAETVALTPDTAVRLARAFDTSAEFWMNFQTAFDINRAEAALEPVLEGIRHIEYEAA